MYQHNSSDIEQGSGRHNQDAGCPFRKDPPAKFADIHSNFNPVAVLCNFLCLPDCHKCRGVDKNTQWFTGCWSSSGFTTSRGAYGYGADSRGGATANRLVGNHGGTKWHDDGRRYRCDSVACWWSYQYNIAVWSSDAEHYVCSWFRSVVCLGRFIAHV